MSHPPLCPNSENILGINTQVDGGVKEGEAVGVGSGVSSRAAGSDGVKWAKPPEPGDKERMEKVAAFLLLLDGFVGARLSYTFIAHCCTSLCT